MQYTYSICLNRLRLFLVAISFFSMGFHLATAQKIQVDLTTLDNQEFQLKGPGLDTLSYVPIRGEFQLTSAGACTLTIDPGANPAAFVYFQVDGPGNISQLEWQDGDASQAEEAIGLSADHYILNGNYLQLKGRSQVLNASLSPGSLVYYRDLTNPLEAHPFGIYTFFPGDYHLLIQASEGDPHAFILEVNN